MSFCQFRVIFTSNSFISNTLPADQQWMYTVYRFVCFVTAAYKRPVFKSAASKSSTTKTTAVSSAAGTTAVRSVRKPPSETRKACDEQQQSAWVRLGGRFLPRLLFSTIAQWCRYYQFSAFSDQAFNFICFNSINFCFIPNVLYINRKFYRILLDLFEARSCVHWANTSYN